MLSRLPIGMFAKALAPRLKYLPVVTRAAWRKHLHVQGDLKTGNGFARKPPYQISLRITNRCNQRCAICGQFGDSGYMNEGDGDYLLSELKFEDYKKVVDDTAHYKPIFYITGGEALLYKDLFKLTEYIKEKGCYVYVITNGASLERNAKQIVEQKWDMLTCSFDGPEAIHDKARGVSGTFKKTARGIKLLLEERGRKPDPYFLLSSTVSESNQDYLVELFDTAAELGPDGLILYLSWFTTQEIGEKHASILKTEMNVDANTWKSYIGQNTRIDAAKVKASLEDIEKKKYPFGWFPVPFIRPEQLIAYYEEPENFLGFGPCVAPYLMIDIMPNGDVVTCRDYIDVKVGNIQETPILDLWNNERFREFRTLLNKEGGTLPQCSRCCGLMGF
jgi:radical SAM protein with 4Fe4S-binding SPASM domain